MGRDTVLFGGQVPIFGESYRRLLQNEKHLNAVYLCIRRWALYSIPGVEIGFLRTIVGLAVTKLP